MPTSRRDEPESILVVKARARAMMRTLAEQDLTPVRHCDCLHALSQQAGYRNWNTYRAMLLREARNDDL